VSNWPSPEVTADVEAQAAAPEPPALPGVPLLASGAADPIVSELGRMLAAVGFENSVSQGLNPFGAVDPSIMQAVHQFRQVHGVVEDPTGFGGQTPSAQQLVDAHVPGHKTWRKLLDVYAELEA
jgi:hypothetical protein